MAGCAPKKNNRSAMPKERFADFYFEWSYPLANTKVQKEHTKFNYGLRLKNNF